MVDESALERRAREARCETQDKERKHAEKVAADDAALNNEIARTKNAFEKSRASTLTRSLVAPPLGNLIRHSTILVASITALVFVASLMLAPRDSSGARKTRAGFAGLTNEGIVYSAAATSFAFLSSWILLAALRRRSNRREKELLTTLPFSFSLEPYLEFLSSEKYERVVELHVCFALPLSEEERENLLAVFAGDGASVVDDHCLKLRSPTFDGSVTKDHPCHADAHAWTRSLLQRLNEIHVLVKVKDTRLHP